MNAESESHPLAMVTATWREYKRWARTSRMQKASQDQARNLTLVLGVVGAILGTLSSQLGANKLATSLSLASAVVIVMAAYLGRELLTPERETIWARCRMLAEALQREVWLALMRVPPYRDGEVSTAIKERTRQLIVGADLRQVPQADSGEEPDAPPVRGVDDYIRLRIEDQIQWYRSSADKHLRRLTRWRRISSWLGGVAILLGVLGARLSEAAAWVPVIVSMSAAVLALVQAGRFQALTPLYQQTARQLELELAAWHDDEIAHTVELVLACEEIMSRENESWRTEWLSKEARDERQGSGSHGAGSPKRPRRDGEAV